MVVYELGNSFSRVAIAGCYRSARVALFMNFWEYINDLPWVQRQTRGILVSHSQLGYLCVGG